MNTSGNGAKHGGDELAPRPRVVIIGGGFAGLYAARALRDTPVDVTLVDRVNHHLFQPLLYQVATSVLNAPDVTVPLRQAVRAPNVTVLMGEVRRLDLASKRVVCDFGELPFDELILAAGASHSYFGHDEWEPFAPGLKTIHDALEMRRRILVAFEMAEREPPGPARDAWLTFVVVGGGPTGVELAGALGEIARHSLRGEFHSIDPSSARILLIEGLPRLLTAYPEDLSDDARERLRQRGVDVRTGAFVTAIDADAVHIGEERIATKTVLWGAGVRASPLARDLGAPLDRAGRVKVEATLALPGRDDVFVAGDLAAVDLGGEPVPGLAPAAMQMGAHAAGNVLRKHRGEPLRAFQYHDRGSFAVVGRGAAIGLLGRGKRRVRGVLAWLLWLGVHISYLAGFRNRLSVLLEWAYAFFTRRRPTRLITTPAPLAAAPTLPAQTRPAPPSGSGDGASARRPPSLPPPTPAPPR